MRIKMAFLVGACFLAGCGGGLFEKYYKGPDDVRTSSPYYDPAYAVPDDDHIQIYSSQDIQADILKMETAGFAPVGVSAFYAPEGDSDAEAGSLRRFAFKLGAQAVLFQSRYKDTISGAVPLVLPNTSTAYTNEQATACGAYGCVNGTGTGTTTTFGTQTVMMPYSTNRSDYTAVYFVKVKSRLGLLVASLSDAERQQLGTNRGSRVVVVVRGSEAFNADVLPGDYLESINDKAVYDQSSLGQLLNLYEGQDTSVVLHRNGKTIKKMIHIDAVAKDDPLMASGTPSVPSASAAPETGSNSVVSYATVIVDDTGNPDKNQAIANKTCEKLGKVAKIDGYRDNGTVSFLCIDK